MKAYKTKETYKMTSKEKTTYYKYKSPAEGYRQISYLHSPAGSYIDTGFTPNSNTKVETEMQWTTSATDNFAFGSGDSYNSNNIELYSATNTFEIHYSGNATIGSYSVNDYFKFIQDKGDITIYNSDGSTNSSYSFGTKTFTCNYTMYIFALHRASVSVCSYDQNLKYFKLWDNGTLVRDFIPVERLSDNVLGLYDKINDVFYTNTGSGTFTGGGYVTEETDESDYDFSKTGNVYSAIKSYEKGQYYGT